MIISQKEFLSLIGVENETLGIWIEEAWLIPEVSPSGMRFSDIDVARARLIRDLQDDLGVNEEGIGIVLKLIDQLHGMRRILTELSRSVDAPFKES
jgi:chaperone modulatory protein CbpM